MKRVGWIIGNGEKNLVWDHNWVPCKEGLRKPLSNITNPNITAKDLWKANRLWDEEDIGETFNNAKDVEDICKIYIPVSNENDKIKFGISQKMGSLQLTRLTEK